MRIRLGAVCALSILVGVAPVHADFILHDFENGTDEFEDVGGSTALDSLVWSTDEASSGVHSLGIHCTFQFGPSEEIHVGEPEWAFHDLSEAETLSVDVYFPATEDFVANLTALVGPQQQFEMSPLTVPQVGWNTFSWDISSLEGRDFVRRIALRVESFVANYSGFIYLDNTRADQMTAGADTALVVFADSDTVDRYECLALTLGWPWQYDNPFDPDDVDVTASFTSPAKSMWEVHGFWTGSLWEVRFAPGEVGDWSYTVTVIDGGGQRQSDPETFYCRPSSDHGWLRVSPGAPHYLEHDDGTSFFGVGHCRCWNLENLGWSADGYQLFDDMEAHGMNLMALWMAPWNLLMVNLLTGADYDTYDLSRAAETDDIVQDAERHGIKLLFHIWDHNSLRDASHAWSGGRWSENGFSNLTDCPTFFTDATSWSWQEKLYRYIIARWGYSKAIGLWGTVCEIDGTNAYGNTDSWHDAINDYFKQNDPFGHPTSASKSGYQDYQGLNESTRWHAGYSAMDLPQLHTYKDPYDPIHIATTTVFFTRIMLDWYEKPIFIGEFGTDDEQYQPQHIHSGIWSGLVSGAATTPLDWNDGGGWGDMSPDMFDHMLIFSQFVEDISFNELSLEPATVSVSGTWLNCWGMADSSFGVAWIQDITPGEWLTGRTFTAQELYDGDYEIEWWNTWDGSLTLRDTASCSGGSFPMTVPDFQKDIACKYSLIVTSDVVEDGRGGIDHGHVSCYPNPFSGRTTLRFSAPPSGEVALDVFDVRGRRVASETLSAASPGLDSIKWDALDDIGTPLPSGIYFYRLQAGDTVSSGRLVVLR